MPFCGSLTSRMTRPFFRSDAPSRLITQNFASAETFTSFTVRASTRTVSIR